MRYFVATLVLAFLSFSAAGAELGTSSKLQPSDAFSNLSDDSQTRYHFIVSSSGPLTSADFPGLSDNTFQLKPLPFISAAGLRLTKSEAATLAKRNNVVQIWYVPDDLYPLYCNIIAALEREVRTSPKPSVANLSLGPPASLIPMVGRDDEPMSIATRKAAESGVVIVMAIGNYGGGDDGMVNPWCHPNWVICVGAATSDAKSVWPSSARGAIGDSRTWPDVVANGVDVISTWPSYMEKSEDRKQNDEANAAFQKSVPKEKWNLYTIESGTSEATPQVARTACLIIAFVKDLGERKHAQPGQALFSITIPQDRYEFGSKRGPRLTGDIKPLSDKSGVEVTYHLVQPWQLVKQLIIDTAVPMPGFSPNVVGAGFVEPAYIEKQFPTSPKASCLIEPVRVVPN